MHPSYQSPAPDDILVHVAVLGIRKAMELNHATPVNGAACVTANLAFTVFCRMYIHCLHVCNSERTKPAKSDEGLLISQSFHL